MDIWLVAYRSTHSDRRTLMKRIAAALLTAVMVLAIAPASPAAAVPTELTIATFNASLNRSEAGQLVDDLSTADNEQARNVAETIQRAGADVLLMNEFDYDVDGLAVDLFRDRLCGLLKRRCEFG